MFGFIYIRHACICGLGLAFDILFMSCKSLTVLKSKKGLAVPKLKGDHIVSPVSPTVSSVLLLPVSDVCSLLFPFLVWSPLIVLYLFFLPGKGEEQALAATVLTLLCLQMGSGPEGEEIFRSLKPLLITILTDSSASPVARQSVSIVSFSGLQQRVRHQKACGREMHLNDFTFSSFLPSLILSPH